MSEWEDSFGRAVLERRGRGAPIDDGAPIPTAIDKRLRDLELEALKLRGELARASAVIAENSRLIRRCADLLRGTEDRLDELGASHASVVTTIRQMGFLLEGGVKPEGEQVN